MPETLHDKQFRVPPLDGSLCVPEIYDWHLVNNSTQPIFTYPNNEDGASRCITYGEFVPAFHRAGRLIAAQLNLDLEGDRKDYPVVAILSIADTISTFTILAGMLRLGVVGFPISPRFSAPVIAHLIQKAGVSDVFISPDHPRLHQLAQDAIALVTKRSDSKGKETMPSLHLIPRYDDLYRRGLPFEPLPKKSYDASSTALIVHSSNSSSEYPKAVPWSVRMQMQHSFIPTKSSHDLRGVIFSCHSIELFHTLGLFFLFWVPTSGLTMATFKPSSPPVKPTSELAFTGIQATRAVYALTHTRFLEEWSQDPDKVSHLRTLKAVLSGGKLLKQAAGDFLAEQGVNLCTMYGSTESGQISAMPSDPQGRDWEYFQLNPQCATQFIDQGNGSFQAFVMGSEAQAPAIVNMQYMGKDAFATGDVLVPHPAKKDHWKVLGRIDDQIMLCTGEVINPVRLENALCANQHVNAAVIFGRSRVRLGVLVELNEPLEVDDASAVESARNLVWPSIQRLNASWPSYSHISREMIIFVQAGKPLAYNPKGSPKRLAALLQYQHEIDMCYKGIADPLLIDFKESEIPTTWDTPCKQLQEELFNDRLPVLHPQKFFPVEWLKAVLRSLIARWGWVL